MTTPSTARKAGPLLGNGSTTAFPFTFKVFAAADVAVTIANSSGVETPLVLNTDYTVTLNSNQDTSPGGTITYPISGAALPSGSKLSIVGDIDYDQPLDLPSGGNFSPIALENQLDRATMQIQQLAEGLSRAAQLPVTNSEDPATLVADIVRLADSANNIDTLVANLADITTVADDLNEPVSEINTVAGAITNVNNVGNNITNVNTVAGISANVTTVAAIDDDVTAVAGVAANVTTVAGVSAAVTAVAAIDDDVTIAAANVGDITNFADVYQGPKTSDPTLRNNGNALQVGDLYFNTVEQALRTYGGTQWVSGTAGTVGVQQFSGNGSTVAFTLATAPAGENNTQIFIGGVYQQKDQYSVSGTTLTFSTAPPSGTNNVEVVTIATLAIGETDASLVSFVQAGTGAVERTAQAKLREVEINVNDFGADHTGSTNSYAAFVAAIAATPTGGTLKLNGTYRCSTGLVITKSMTIAGVDHRVANVPSGALSKSFLYFDTNVPVGIDVQGCVLTIDGAVVSGIGLSSTGQGIRSRLENNSLILTGGSVVQGFTTGVRLENGYYNKIDNATIAYCKNGLIVDNVYNLVASALTLSTKDWANGQGITLLNGSQMTMLGGSVENATLYGVATLGGSSLTLVGTYFENNGGFNVYLAANSSVNAIGCLVYLTTGSTSFISVESASATGARVYSRNNRFVYPTDSTAIVVYQPIVNDATCYWDVAGDNWQSPIGSNVIYAPGGWYALKGNVSIQFPTGHPNYGKNINTVPVCTEPAISAMSGTPKGGTQVFWGNAGFSGDDPIGIEPQWGYNSYAAVYQKGQWEKVGLRLPNQVNSTASTVEGVVADLNALLAKLRAAGVMV